MENLKYNTRPGRLLAVTKGEYSDHCLIGFFVVLNSFNFNTELTEYLDAHPEQKEDYRFNEDEFLAALLAKGYLLEIDHDTMHLGAYGCADRSAGIYRAEKDE